MRDRGFHRAFLTETASRAANAAAVGLPPSYACNPSSHATGARGDAGDRDGGEHGGGGQPGDDRRSRERSARPKPHPAVQHPPLYVDHPVEHTGSRRMPDCYVHALAIPCLLLEDLVQQPPPCVDQPMEHTDTSYWNWFEYEHDRARLRKNRPCPVLHRVRLLRSHRSQGSCLQSRQHGTVLLPA